MAEILFGKHDPEGRLPVSFDRSWQDNPSYPYYYPIKGADTSLHVTEPGHPPVDYVIPPREIRRQADGGLSLLDHHRQASAVSRSASGSATRPSASANLNVPATAASGSTVPVSFDVTNTGSVAGAEVAQLYVSDPSAKVKRPERELKGFEKVRLAPGETKHVTSISMRAPSATGTRATHKWTIDPGKFVIRVGDSSENTPLHADVTLN